MKSNGLHSRWAALAVCVILLLAGTDRLQAAKAPAFEINGRQLIDQAGRQVAVERPFTRIISLYGAHTENLFALGLTSEIIGVSRNEVWPPQVARKRAYSYHDDAEKFLAAAPDLVLVRPMIDRGYPKLLKRLEKSGIRVVSLQPATVSEIYRYWRVLGLLTGRELQAAQMVARMQTAVSVIKTVTQAITPKKQVYFEAIHRRMKTFAPGATAIFALETAGGVNVAADAKPVRRTNIAAYGKERILARGREIDVFLSQSGVMNRATPEMIRNEPGFGAIKAVAKGDIHLIDEKIVSRPTLRLIDGICEINRRLYPEIHGRQVEPICRQFSITVGPAVGQGQLTRN